MLLCYITDRHAFPGTEADQRQALVRKTAEAARAGIDFIQLREKDLSARDLEHLAREAVSAVRTASTITRLLINSRTDIALACDADGVHLPSGDIPASEVRTLWSKCRSNQPVISVAAHSIDEVRLAHSHGADFVVLAPIFEKVQAATAGIGIDLLRQACSFSPAQPNVEASEPGHFPVLALGGVTVDNARACLAAGAAGVAGIRLFQAGTISETVQRLRSIHAS
jgi:thiamine-phosphate pyrophosphorylase